MKFIQILLFLVISLVSCKVQQEPIIIKADLDAGLIPGGCYFSLKKDEGTKKELRFILEIVPPKYEMTEIEYPDTDLEKYSIGKGKYQFKVRYTHFNFFMNTKTDLSEFTIVENPIGYMYCMVENPVEYMILTKEELQKKGNRIPFMKIVKQSKIIKTYVRKKPKKLNENQYFFEDGYWTEIKRAVSGSH